MKLSFKINKAPELIFNYLTDMQKFVSVHPLITKIDKTNSDSYLVYETIKLGFIPISFAYPVTIESKQLDNIVIMRATVMKLAHIEMIFELKQENNFTIIEENINFKSLLPINSILGKIFKKQHKQLFQNIESL